LNIVDELPKDFKPLVILGEIDGYLHVFSFLDNDTILALLEMAAESIMDNDYDEKTTTLQ
jgi:hypothetical protein